MECRICYENNSKEKLISPCSCSGSMKYIHRSCLEKCIFSSKSNICPICKDIYKFNENKFILFVINNNVITSVITLFLYFIISIFSLYFKITLNTIFVCYFILLFGMHYTQNLLNYHYINFDSIFENLIIFSNQPYMYTSKISYLFFTNWIIIDKLKKYLLIDLL